MISNDSPRPAEAVAHPAALTARPATPRPAPRPARDTDRIWALPGLCWNASVMTSFGALPVQVLRKHDPLRLPDGQIRRIEWVDKIQLDEDFVMAYPDAQPVQIRAGALGLGLPLRDITVSPGQKLALRGLGHSDNARQARDLVGRPGVLRQPQSMVTYYLFHCGQPAAVQAEGLSLLTGP